MKGYEHLETHFGPNDTTFADLYPALIGPPGLEQFLVHSNELFCIRPSCDGCPFFNAGCDFEESKLSPALVPHARRGVGFEERPFLILSFRDGESFDTLPVELWDNPFANLAYKHPSNLHWAYTDPDTAVFHTLKGQLRYYGTRDEFEASPYAAHLQVFDEYEAVHFITSLDYSAIEPRVNTIVTREPKWVATFEGEPKAIFREIAIAAGAPEKRPHYVETHLGRDWCYLDAEMDKGTFEDQCATAGPGKTPCPLRDFCTTVQDHLKNVPTDWHGVNAAGLYGEEFTEQKDKFKKKELRGDAKIVGLAITYGGTAFTVSKTMGCSVEVAQQRVESFLRELTVLKAYMEQAEQQVYVTGRVANLFGRERDVSADAWASRNKDLSFKEIKRRENFARNTALNGPIQGTAAELLKLGMIRAAAYIKEHKLNPFAIDHVVQDYGDELPTYRDLRVAMASSIHDEVMNLIKGEDMPVLIPPLYSAMQISDVLEKLKVKFSLEMDCEFDKTHSWTATSRFETTRIYMLRHIQSNPAAPSALDAHGMTTRANLALVPYDAVTPAALEQISMIDRKQDEIYGQGGVADEEPSFQLGVRHEDTGRYYIHSGRFRLADLQALGFSPRLVYYHDKAA